MKEIEVEEITSWHWVCPNCGAVMCVSLLNKGEIVECIYCEKEYIVGSIRYEEKE